MKKIDVTHIIPKLDYGGTEKAVEIIVNNSGGNVDSTILVLDRLGVRGQRLLNSGEDIRLVETLKKLREYFQKSNVDVVHIHSQFDRGKQILKIINEFSIPAVIKSLHFGKSDDASYENVIDNYIHIGKMILLRHLLLNNLSTSENGWRNKHKFIYNPIDLSEMDPNADPSFRKQFNIPDDASVIGKIGRSAPEKWGKILIDAYSIINNKRPETHLLLANTPDKIRKNIQNKDLDNVHFVEKIPLGEVDEFHNSLDILTHSSAIGECTPYVFLEAMATHTPIVVNSQPMRDNGQIEIVDHGSTGYIANTPEAYANATIELIESPETRKRMGKNAFRKVSKNHSVENIVRQIESLYALTLVENGAYDRSELQWLDDFEDDLDLEEFSKEYRKRLQEYYGEPGARFRLELLSWKLISNLPFGTKTTYELVRKGFLFIDEYL